MSVAQRRAAAWCVVLVLSFSRAAGVQRELHWDRLDVEARLDAAGRLHVTETQSMVFTGDWNGGERTFNLRPRQILSFTGISRVAAGGLLDLKEDRTLSRVDDYAWTDARTLRWRSRLPTDPPFARTTITYVLRYQLSGILVRNGDEYRLDHDFAFPDRVGTIDRFNLRLTLDSAWQPLTGIQDVYATSGLEPGRGFVLTIRLRFTGAGQPEAQEGISPRVIALAVAVVLGVTALAVLAFFVREESHGRFVPVATDHIDEGWIAEQVMKYPAEVVGAAWDDSIGTPEVVALIARLVGEGKLESDVARSGAKASMTLRLKADRSALEGHERTLVDALFFDGRRETSTKDMRAHYRRTGFDPAAAIRPELEARVRVLLEAGDPPRFIGPLGVVWFLACAALIGAAWYRGETGAFLPLFVGIAALAVAGIVRGTGASFRARMDWGRMAALLCLLPALIFAAATAAFIYLYVGHGAVDLSPLALVAIVGLTLWVTYNAIRGLQTRTSRQAVAVRKNLTAARAFFSAKVQQPHAALRDEWYPWLLALGLGKEADDWSARRMSTTDADRRDRSSGYSSSSGHGEVASGDGWSGFGGGRSGSGGAGAAWSVGAASMAAPVEAPHTSSSSSDSSSGSSDSGGSSGGGGGGGW
jgi:uncharacterized membrane protein YgcG